MSNFPWSDPDPILQPLQDAEAPEAGADPPEEEAPAQDTPAEADPTPSGEGEPPQAEPEAEQQPTLDHSAIEQLVAALALEHPEAAAAAPEDPEQAHQVTSNALRHAVAVLKQQIEFFSSPGSLNFLPDHPVRQRAEYLLGFLTCDPIQAHMAPEVRRRAAAPEA